MAESAAKVRKILLIRHGQTDFNRERRLQGGLPVPLNAHGRAQARALAQYLQPLSIDRIHASPLARADETAQIVGAALQRTVHHDPRLREIGFGLFEGLTYAQAKARHPQVHRLWQGGYMRYRVPGGESRRDVQRRMHAAWADAAALPDAAAVALVSHGSAIKLLLAHLYARLPDRHLPNTSITTLERDGEVWHITGYGITPHLP